MYQLLKRANEFIENSIWRSRDQYNPENGGVLPASKNAPATDSSFAYSNGLLYDLLNSSISPIIVTGGTITDSNILTYLQNSCTCPVSCQDTFAGIFNPNFKHFISQKSIFV